MMPRAFLEHGGSEDPAVEVRLDSTLQQDQESWVRAERVMESTILVNALELLGQTGFPSDRVTLKFGHEDDMRTLFSSKPDSAEADYRRGWVD